MGAGVRRGLAFVVGGRLAVALRDWVLGLRGMVVVVVAVVRRGGACWRAMLVNGSGKVRVQDPLRPGRNGEYTMDGCEQVELI